MRVLVTGAAGFLGSAVLPQLVAAGHEVTGTDITKPPVTSAVHWVTGDLGDQNVRTAALDGCEAVIHLATIPGGAAEDHPAEASRLNVGATIALSQEWAEMRRGAPFVFASSIAVFGHPLPAMVDDQTPLRPQMLYGGHKAMIELWLAALHRRGDLSALSLRLPGLVARPEAPSGMKSAFISNLFHALAQRRAITLPVGPEATMWLASVTQTAGWFVRSLTNAAADIGAERAITMPSLRVAMNNLVEEICDQTGSDPQLVTYRPDRALEAGFGTQPPLSTPLADGMGYRHHGDLTRLVSNVLTTFQSEGRP